MTGTRRTSVWLVLQLACAVLGGCVAPVKPSTPEARAREWREVVTQNRAVFDEATDLFGKGLDAPQLMTKLQDLGVHAVSVRNSFVLFYLPSHFLDGNRYLVAPTPRAGQIQDTFPSASYQCDLGGIFYLEN